MNILFARFSLLLVMIVAIAGTSLVQGGTASSPENTVSTCAAEPAVAVTADNLQTREHLQRPSQRVVRWQSFLPGAFR